MSVDVLVGCLLIILARLCDVTLGTIRTISVVHGRAALAWVLGFFEVLIWVFAVSAVIRNLDSPLYAIAYAIGFATGNYLGILVENRIGIGEQVVRIFTRRGAELAAALRQQGLRLTEFDGRGREGTVSLLFIKTARRQTPRIVRQATAMDPACFYVVDDVRITPTPFVQRPQSTVWRRLRSKR
jgi:uncharacterized protein YebE (UPF0316 family)